MIRQQRGFTLLEMMVALAIFSLVSLMGYQILQSVLRNSEMTRQHSEQLSKAARLFALLQLDLSQAMIPADVSTLAGDAPFHASSDSADILRLTRRNWLNPDQLPRSTLQRVAWRLSGDTLQRISLSDDRVSAEFHTIRTIRLRFWANGRWHPRWTATGRLPDAVEVTLDLPPWHALQRVILLPGAAS